MHISTSLHTSSSLFQQVFAYANFKTIISIPPHFITQISASYLCFTFASNFKRNSSHFKSKPLQTTLLLPHQPPPLYLRDRYQFLLNGSPKMQLITTFLTLTLLLTPLLATPTFPLEPRNEDVACCGWCGSTCNCWNFGTENGGCSCGPLC
jgi:hypothetical protein